MLRRKRGYSVEIKMASEVGGFRTICVKFNEKCSSYHFLYFKKHSMRDEDATKPSDKTLFVVNIPPYCTKVRLLCLNTCLANTFFFTTCIKNQALYSVEAHWCSSWRVGFRSEVHWFEARFL